MASAIPQWTIIEASGHHHTFEDPASAMLALPELTWRDRGATLRTPEGLELAVIRRSTERSIHIVSRA